MIFLLAVLAAVVGAVLGYVVTATVAVAIAGLFGMSDFEGGRGMFGAFVAGPVGGLAAMVSSAWIALRIGYGPAPLATTLARVGAVIASIALLVTAAILVRLHTLDVYTNTLPPTLEFEIRVPEAMAVPDPSALRVELHTDKNIGEGQLFDDWSPTGDGHRAIRGSVPLAFKTWSRLLVVPFPDQPTRLFKLPLSRDPSSTATASEWQRATFVDVAGEQQPRSAPADDPVEIRYRVRRADED